MAIVGAAPAVLVGGGEGGGTVAVGAAPPASTPYMEAALDELRRHLARKLDLIRGGIHSWLWVTEFPMFDWDEETGRVVAAHHPFTAPHSEDVQRLRELVEAAGEDPPSGRDLYAARLAMGQDRGKIEEDAELFFARLIPAAGCPEWFNEADYDTLKLIRNQWI